MNRIQYSISLFFFSITLFIGLSSFQASPRKVNIEIENVLPIDRTYEIVEVPMTELRKSLDLKNAESIVVLNTQGEEVPYQITSDDKLIFPVGIAALTTIRYTIKVGQSSTFSTLACGKYYAERLDDIAWENDVVAFRAYGPGTKEKGYKLYGYDVFTKNNTSRPVVEERYALDLDSTLRAKINELRNSYPEAASELSRATSYHIDHGNGMDCYAVGPTLGGGACALLSNDTLVYPHYYHTYEILDNGPLRFKLKLNFSPIAIENDSAVVERRLITLDAGSYLNKTEIVYESLSQSRVVATGIVLHDRKNNVTCNAAQGFISYVDPTQGDNNGLMFMGAVFPNQIDKMEVSYFSPQEKKLRDDAEGHVLAFSTYSPLDTHTYYWGSAWNKGKITTITEWETYLSLYYMRLLEPLKVTIVI